MISSSVSLGPIYAILKDILRPRAIRWCRRFSPQKIIATPRRLPYPPLSVDLCAPYGPIMCFREWRKTGRHDPSGMSGGALAGRARSVDKNFASSQCKLQRRRYRRPHADFTSLKEPVLSGHNPSTDRPQTFHICSVQDAALMPRPFQWRCQGAAGCRRVTL